MKSIFLILTLLLSQMAIAERGQNDNTIITELISSSVTKVEEKVRTASVKIMMLNVHILGCPYM